MQTGIASQIHREVVCVSCGEVSDQGWGLLTSIRLPGGGELGLYEPRHPKATDL